MSNVSAPSERPQAPVVSATVTASYGPRKSSLGWILLGAGVIASLIGFNAWWYWRETRPLPDLRTVSDWMQREQYARAEPVLREHLRRSPHDGEARTMLARVLAGRGDSLGCARQLHEVPGWWPTKAEALLREGQSYIKIDRAREAESSWLELIKDDPLHPVSADVFHDACQGLLKIYAVEDRWEDAYPVIWTAYDHASPIDQPALLTMRMRPELERVAPKESIEVLRRYVAATPDDWEAIRALARAEKAVGRQAEAAQHFQEILKSRPDDVRAWRDYLALLLEQGELDAFLDLLDRPPASADTEPETWMFRGMAREKAGDWQAATELFQKAIDLDPTVPKYYYQLAMAEERLGLRKQAIAHRERTKEMNEARGRLLAAFSDYFAAQTPGKAGAPTWRRPAAVSLRFAKSWAGPAPPRLGIDWRTRRETTLLGGTNERHAAFWARGRWLGMIAIATALAAGGLQWAPARAFADPLKRGTAAYAHGDWEEAARLARVRLKASADDSAALKLLARASVRQGRTSTALAAFDRLGPQALLPEDLYLLGIALKNEGNDKRAVQVWEQARAADPRHAETLLNLTIAYTAARRPLAASETARALASCPGWEARAESLQGGIELELNDPASAVTHWQRALGRDVKELGSASMPALLHQEMARALLQAGRPVEARTYLQSLLAEGPTPERFWLLSRAYLQERKTTDALAAWKQSGSFRDDNPLVSEPAQYVGSLACAPCHRATFQAQQSSRHARTFYRASELGDARSTGLDVLRTSPTESLARAAANGRRPNGTGDSRRGPGVPCGGRIRFRLGRSRSDPGRTR